jgi:hypothetical protein
MISPDSSSKICWICGKAVSLQTSKTDEHGNAVHESCQVLRLSLAKSPQAVKDPAGRHARRR